MNAIHWFFIGVLATDLFILAGLWYIEHAATIKDVAHQARTWLMTGVCRLH